MQDYPIEDNEGILSKSIRSGSWLVLGNFLQRGIGFASFFILARLLTPADFGIMAIVLLVPNTLQSLTETGLSQAVLQRGRDPLKYLDAIWSIGIIRALIIAGATFVFGPAIAQFFHAQEAALAIRLGGVFILIYNASNIGEFFFYKNLDFKKIFIRNISKDIVYVIGVVILIFFYRSYWALVAATLASYTTQTIATYFLHPYRPTFTINLRPLRDLYWYSKWIVGQGWLEKFFGFLEQTTVARFTNINAIGLYIKAKNVASVAPGFLSPILNIVGFSAYTHIQGFPEKVKDGFLKNLHMLFFLLIPITLVMLVGGGKLVSIFFGQQWLPMTNILRIFIVFYLLDSVMNHSLTLLNALGYPDKKVTILLIKIPLTFIFVVYLTAVYSITGTALGVALGVIPSTLLTIYYIIKLTMITFRDIANTIIAPLSVSSIVLLSVLFYKDTLIQLATPPLFFVIISMSCVYVIVIYAIGKRFGYGPYPTIEVIIHHLKVGNQ